MQDPATLSKDQLLEVLAEKEKSLAQKDESLARKDDTISQLEVKLEAKERAYLKLWQERFAAKSERYIADPDLIYGWRPGDDV